MISPMKGEVAMNATTQDARPSGPEIRQRVFGAPTGKPTAPGGGDRFLAPFFDTAIEHVWGGVWNRPGLELKYRSLVVVSVLAATGHNEELKTHLRGARNPGWTVDELREALLQKLEYATLQSALLGTPTPKGFYLTLRGKFMESPQIQPIVQAEPDQPLVETLVTRAATG